MNNLIKCLPEILVGLGVSTVVGVILWVGLDRAIESEAAQVKHYSAIRDHAMLFGFESAKAGATSDANPYSKSSERAELWLRGWMKHHNEVQRAEE